MFLASIVLRSHGLICTNSAPTGTGKTVLFELAVIRLLQSGGNGLNSANKCVYMAPTKVSLNLSIWWCLFIFGIGYMLRAIEGLDS
jgi:superfamily II DNA/RNA helicase